MYILQNISIWVPWRKAIQGFAYIKVCIQVSIFECGRVHYHYWHYDCSLSICCTCFGFSEPWRLNRETKHTDTVFSNLLSSHTSLWTDGIHADRAPLWDIESLSLHSNRESAELYRVAIEWKGASPVRRTEIDGLMAQLCSEDLGWRHQAICDHLVGGYPVTLHVSWPLVETGIYQPMGWVCLCQPQMRQFYKWLSGLYLPLLTAFLT